MAKGRFKNVIAASLVLVAASALQAVPAMAAPSTGTVVTWQASQGKTTGTETGITVNNKLGMILTSAKGCEAFKYSDPNREEYRDPTATDKNLRVSRYTHKDGTPYTGLYLETDNKGNAKTWLVLDSDGFLRRSQAKHQYVWDGGQEAADFVVISGPNYNAYENKNYLGYTYTKNGGVITYIQMSKWISQGTAWYKSNDKGICYQNQWYKDTDGKWYYFDNNCQMVTSKLVDGYWIDANGVCQ